MWLCLLEISEKLHPWSHIHTTTQTRPENNNDNNRPATMKGKKFYGTSNLDKEFQAAKEYWEWEEKAFLEKNLSNLLSNTKWPALIAYTYK